MKNYFLIVAVVLAFWPAARSNAGDCCHQPIVCPQCKTHCKLSIEQVKEKKHRYEVECVAICIPKVRFPWRKCEPPKCAKTKMIHVLKKISYTCDKCAYIWTPVCGECDDCRSAQSTLSPSAASAKLSIPLGAGAFAPSKPSLPVAPAPSSVHRAPKLPPRTKAQPNADASQVGISLFVPRIR